MGTSQATGTENLTPEQRKVLDDIRKCAATWEAAEIPPSVALYVAIRALASITVASASGGGSDGIKLAREALTHGCWDGMGVRIAHGMIIDGAEEDAARNMEYVDEEQ